MCSLWQAHRMSLPPEAAITQHVGSCEGQSKHNEKMWCTQLSRSDEHMCPLCHACCVAMLSCIAGHRLPASRPSVLLSRWLYSPTNSTAVFSHSQLPQLSAGADEQHARALPNTSAYELELLDQRSCVVSTGHVRTCCSGTPAQSWVASSSWPTWQLAACCRCVITATATIEDEADRC